MGLIQKIKDFFSKKEEPKEEAPKEQEIVQQTIPEPKGEIIGPCPLCRFPLGSLDKTKEINGNKVHKRCFKKAIRLTQEGKNLQTEFTKQ